MIMSISNRNSLPVGLGMSLALDVDAMSNFVNLSEEKRGELVNYIENSTTGDEAKNRVREVVSNLHTGDSFR